MDEVKIWAIQDTSKAVALESDRIRSSQASDSNETWGSEAWPELVFPLDAAGWETHKECLHALTRAVYEAWESRDHEEDSA